VARFIKVTAWIFGSLVAAIVVYLLAFFLVPYMQAPDFLNREEATLLLSSELAHYRTKTYQQISELVDMQEIREVAGKSGAVYTVEVSAYWDDEPNQDIRVIASISDGGKSAYVPMTDDFILSPTGRFVGE
jgi:hypothetical protein